MQDQTSAKAHVAATTILLRTAPREAHPFPDPKKDVMVQRIEIVVTATALLSATDGAVSIIYPWQGQSKHYLESSPCLYRMMPSIMTSDTQVEDAAPEIIARLSASETGTWTSNVAA